MPLSKSILHPRPVSFLYRKVLKSIPRVMVLYDLDMTHKQIQLSVRKLFRQHSQVSDPRILDRLLHLGEQNLEETLQQWKQKTHLARMLRGDV